MSRSLRTLSLLAVLLVLTGCAAGKSKGIFGRLLEPAPLKVGIVRDSPPLAYAKDNELAGLERQFAAGLADSMERKLELVELRRDDLAPALLGKKIDIVMAGMTVAEAHKQKLATAAPYLQSGQTTLVRLSDYDRLGNGIRQLTEPSTRLGVVAGGAADAWLKGLKPKGTISRFATAPEGVQALINGGIDVFLNSQPANYHYASLYLDKGLTPGNIILAKEELAWAVRPNNADLLKSANAYLAAIEQNGELQKMLERAIPFYRNTAYSPKQ